jgi:hypothetical protein
MQAPTSFKAQVDPLSQNIMLSFLLLFLPAVLVLATGTRPLSRRPHCRNDSSFNESVSSSLAVPASVSSKCFPCLGFKTPSNVPSSIDGWWCSPTTEYAFLGFSYEVTSCTSVSFNES